MGMSSTEVSAFGGTLDFVKPQEFRYGFVRLATGDLLDNMRAQMAFNNEGIQATQRFLD